MNSYLNINNILSDETKINKQGVIYENIELAILNGYSLKRNIYSSYKGKKCFVYNYNVQNDNIENNNLYNLTLFDFTDKIPYEISLNLSDRKTYQLNEAFNFLMNYERPALSTDNSNVILVWQATQLQDQRPYGYLAIDVEVSKIINTDVNCLYFADFSARFTPGVVANYNDESYYEDYLITSGYFHLEVLQAVEDLGPNQKRLGGIPNLKDAYPNSSTGKVTITSSVDVGFTFGTSFDNGFSTSDEYTYSEGVYTGASINFGYEKSITTDDPILSAQRSPSTHNKFLWNFEMKKDEISSITYTLDCGLIFDMDERKNQTYDDAMQLRYEYRIDYKEDTWFFPSSKTITSYNTIMFP